MSGEDLSWIPAYCPNGHELHALTKRSRISLSFDSCRCPVGLRNERWPGHHNAFCNECKAEMRPPGCDR